MSQLIYKTWLGSAGQSTKHTPIPTRNTADFCWIKYEHKVCLK